MLRRLTVDLYYEGDELRREDREKIKQAAKEELQDLETESTYIRVEYTFVTEQYGAGSD